MSHSAGDEPEPCSESGLRLSRSLLLIYRLLSLKITGIITYAPLTEGKTLSSLAEVSG